LLINSELLGRVSIPTRTAQAAGWSPEGGGQISEYFHLVKVILKESNEAVFV